MFCKTLVKDRLGILYVFLALFVFISFLVRSVLLVRSLPHLDLNGWGLLSIYGVGLFFDLITAAYVSVPYVLYLVLVPDSLYRSRPHRPFLYMVTFISLYLLAFIAVAEIYFFDEFGVRFNFIAVDYLIYTNEVLKNIHESYPLFPILTGIGILALLLFLVLKSSLDASCRSQGRLRQRLAKGGVTLAIPALALGFVDLSFTHISANMYANEMAANGIYSFSAAFWHNRIEYDSFYATLDNGVVFRRLRGMLREPHSTFLSDDPQDIRRHIRNGPQEKRLNVVLIVVESLSAEFVGAFGGRSRLTPNLDRLAAESLLFTNMYATGTRTDRGLESIVLSVPPTPGRSIVKRPNNEEMFSVGFLLQERGYDTKFVYGGYGYFDNMNYFFTHNGFTAVDRTDLRKEEITFENAWGVCDEDLYRKALSEIRRSFENGRPLFALVLTTSNHRPYTYPSGRIDIPSGTGRQGAVKYTDYAIGKFLEDARLEPWFADTLFVIVADHCANSAGKVALPVDRYRIPLLVYAPGHISPGRTDTLASQMDIGPTLLALLHVDYPTKFFGRNALLISPEEGRALLGTYQKLGYYSGDRLVVLDVKRKVDMFRRDPKTKEATRIPPESDAIEEAISYYQGADYLHQQRLDRRSVGE